MSGIDKVKNLAQDLSGKAHEAIGKVTGDSDKQAEGRVDQVEADVKQAGENVKDAVRDI